MQALLLGSVSRLSSCLPCPRCRLAVDRATPALPSASTRPVFCSTTRRSRRGPTTLGGSRSRYPMLGASSAPAWVESAGIYSKFRASRARAVGHSSPAGEHERGGLPGRSGGGNGRSFRRASRSQLQPPSALFLPERFARAAAGHHRRSTLRVPSCLRCSRAGLGWTGVDAPRALRASPLHPGRAFADIDVDRVGRGSVYRSALGQNTLRRRLWMVCSDAAPLVRRESQLLGSRSSSFTLELGSHRQCGSRVLRRFARNLGASLRGDWLREHGPRSVRVRWCRDRRDGIRADPRVLCGGQLTAHR